VNDRQTKATLTADRENPSYLLRPVVERMGSTFVREHLEDMTDTDKRALFHELEQRYGAT
jgi:hypothetical protein